MKKILVLGLLFVSSVVLAGEPVSIGEKKTFLSAVAGNAAAGSLTFVVPLGGSSTARNAMQMLNLFLNMNYTATTSAVTLTCSASDDSGSTLFALQTCAVASGTCTSSDAVFYKAITADKKWAWRVDFTGYNYGSCVVAITGGAANESITVTGWMSSK